MLHIIFIDLKLYNYNVVLMHTIYTYIEYMHYKRCRMYFNTSILA